MHVLKMTLFFGIMKNRLFLFAILCLSALCSWAQQPDFSMIGYAAMEGEGDFYHAGGTTGGEGGQVVTPQTFEELKRYVEDPSTPYIIRVTKEFTTGYPCKVDNEGQISESGVESTYGEVLRVGSNKTLLGVGSEAFFNRIGLVIQTQSNIIIRNIKFSMAGVPVAKTDENKILAWRNGAEVTVGDPDCISIQADENDADTDFGHHYWVDHCEFFNENGVDKDRYDGLLDMKNNVQYTTISWCKFHNHSKACLSGKGNSDQFPRTVTMHHNYFYNIQGSRLPLQRGGIYHYYNNMQEECQDGYDLRANAVAYIEGCYFKNTKAPVMSSGEGESATLVDLIFDGCNRIPEGFTDLVNEKLDEVYSIPSSDYRPPYNYTADRAADIPNIVPQWCGVGKIDDIQEGYPEITITKPAANAVITYEEGLAVDVEFTVTDEDGTVAEVTLAVDNAPVDYEVSGNQYTARLENVALGRHTIEVKAADNDGNETARSLAFTVAEYTEMAVETLPATDVTAASAVLNGTFAANSDVVTAQGFVYGQQADLSDGAEVAAPSGSYELTGLDAATTYYYKAFIRKEGKTIEGGTLSFTTKDVSTPSAGAMMIDAVTPLPDGFAINFEQTGYTRSEQEGQNLILLEEGTYTITVPAGLTVTSLTVYGVVDNNTDYKGSITIAGVTKDLTNRKAAPLEFTVSPLSLQGSIPFELTYKSAVKFALVTESSTGISTVEAQKGEPVAVQYYTLSGMQVDEPSKGFYIVRKVYGDGTAVAGKEYYK